MDHAGADQADEVPTLPGPHNNGGVSTARRMVRIAILVLVVLSAALLVWPQAFGAQRLPGIAQLIAFRAPLGIALATLASVAGVAALVRRPGHRALAVGLAAVFAAAAVANTAVLVLRGSGAQLESIDTFPPSAHAGTALTVVSWNTQGGATSPEEIARFVLAARADVVALPETDAHAATEITRLLAEQGLHMIPHTTGETIPTSVLISEASGEYRLDSAAGSTPGLPSGVWLPAGVNSGDELAPVIVVAHPMPPLLSTMEEWRIGLDWIAAQCRALGPNVVIAGDLNATVDHLWGIEGCHDAALDTDTAALGTWPSTQPAWLASPIDHVLAGASWRTSGFQVVEGGDDGSDHRPIIAVLTQR